MLVEHFTEFVAIGVRIDLVTHPYLVHFLLAPQQLSTITLHQMLRSHSSDQAGTRCRTRDTLHCNGRADLPFTVASFRLYLIGPQVVFDDGVQTEVNLAWSMRISKRRW
jgi:hypothetical protein